MAGSIIPNATNRSTHIADLRFERGPGCQGAPGPTARCFPKGGRAQGKARSGTAMLSLLRRFSLPKGISLDAPDHARRSSLAVRGRRRTYFRFVRPGFGEGEGEGTGDGAMSIAVNAWASQASMITDSRSPLKSLLS